MTRASALEHFI